MDIIAEHTFEIRYPNGLVNQVHVKFERPSPHPTARSAWGCVVHMEGTEIMGRPKAEIYGDDSLQALMLATTFAYRLLSYEVEDRGATVESLTTVFGRSDDPKTP